MPLPSQPLSSEESQRLNRSLLTIHCHSGDSPRRQELESLIRLQYQRVHQAYIGDFSPTLLSLEDEAHKVRALVGLRAASEGALFLERYLDRPIEVELARQLALKQAQQDETQQDETQPGETQPGETQPGETQSSTEAATSTPERNGIIELGNLISMVPGGMKLLFGCVELWLRARGTEWAVFTATRTVRRGLRLQGFRMLQLGSATVDKLEADEARAWGSYYENAPWVLAISRESLRERTADLVWPPGLDTSFITQVAADLSCSNSNRSVPPSLIGRSASGEGCSS